MRAARTTMEQVLGILLTTADCVLALAARVQTVQLAAASYLNRLRAAAHAANESQQAASAALLYALTNGNASDVAATRAEHMQARLRYELQYTRLRKFLRATRLVADRPLGGHLQIGALMRVSVVGPSQR